VGCQAGCTRIQAQILNHWAAQTYNAGCYNPLSVLDDGHTPSPHALGEAIDIGILPAFRGRTSYGQEIFLWLHANVGRLGIVQLIYCEQIWSASNQPGSIRPYMVNPHFDHIHCQLNPTAARDASLTAEPLPGAAPAPVPPPPEEVETEVSSTASWGGVANSFYVTADGHVWQVVSGRSPIDVSANAGQAPVDKFIGPLDAFGEGPDDFRVRGPLTDGTIGDLHYHRGAPKWAASRFVL